MVPSLAHLSYEEKLKKLKPPPLIERESGEMIAVFSATAGVDKTAKDDLLLWERNDTRPRKYKLLRKTLRIQFFTKTNRLVDWLAWMRKSLSPKQYMI